MAKTTKTQNTYSEIDDIRKDINSLKTNVVELTKHLQSDGKERANDLSIAAKSKFEELQGAGKAQLDDVEQYVRDKPTQSVAYAFLAGAAISILFSRR